MALQIH